MKKNNVVRDDGYYYDIKKDLELYPDAWMYVIVGGRNVGKTYGALRYMYENDKKFVFIKRTMEDVDLITTSGKEDDLDFSPFKSLNRDGLTNVSAEPIKKGLGRFRSNFEDTDENGEPFINHKYIGTLIALAAVAKYKGFDMSENDFLLFDEFIKQPWERGSRLEGEQLLSLYKTVMRDRIHRNNKNILKCICLANSTQINNPVCRTLDIIEDLQLAKPFRYIKERGIFVRNVEASQEFMKVERNDILYKAMGNTKWGRMTYDNEFSYNDFSRVTKRPLKGYKPYCIIYFDEKTCFVYKKENELYMCSSSFNAAVKEYDLNKDSDKLRFNTEQRFYFMDRLETRLLYCEKYIYYDLILNINEVIKLSK